MNAGVREVEFRGMKIELSERAKLAYDTLLLEPRREVPSWQIHIMQHEFLERIAGVSEGEYRKAPEKTYLAFLERAGVCLLDQFIPENPLTMGKHGYESYEKAATTGAEKIIIDDTEINSPETVVEHLERFVFPSIRKAIENFDEEKTAKEIIERERTVQHKLGPNILKSGYGFVRFPSFAHTTYGYLNYFQAFALYPDVMERHFSLQADLAELNNRCAVRAILEGGLPPLYRLDHDMADSRGTLVRIEALERLWFPHFTRSIKSLVRAGIRLIWHCDGNLMEMVPRLVDAGVGGFQGFQYECGMDYEKVCSMRTKDGEELVIFAGVSVTRTLPFGTPDDVRNQMRWLVEKGPRKGLFLACSSSVVPGTPWENIRALLEGLHCYRTHGRD